MPSPIDYFQLSLRGGDVTQRSKQGNVKLHRGCSGALHGHGVSKIKKSPPSPCARDRSCMAIHSLGDAGDSNADMNCHFWNDGVDNRKQQTSPKSTAQGRGSFDDDSSLRNKNGIYDLYGGGLTTGGNCCGLPPRSPPRSISTRSLSSQSSSSSSSRVSSLSNRSSAPPTPNDSRSPPPLERVYEEEDHESLANRRSSIQAVTNGRSRLDSNQSCKSNGVTTNTPAKAKLERNLSARGVGDKKSSVRVAASSCTPVKSKRPAPLLRKSLSGDGAARNGKQNVQRQQQHSPLSRSASDRSPPAAKSPSAALKSAPVAASSRISHAKSATPPPSSVDKRKNNSRNSNKSNSSAQPQVFPILTDSLTENVALRPWKNKQKTRPTILETLCQQIHMSVQSIGHLATKDS